MKIVVSGGGTAGHVNPALALAHTLKAAGHEVLFIGCPDGMEARLATGSGFEFRGLAAAGFNRAHPLTLFTSSFKIARSALRARKYFKQYKPDAVIGFGGYVALPVGLAAGMCHVPLLIHEQNSVPGLANRILAKRGAILALTYETSRKYFDCPKEHIHVIGNPVRDSILTADRQRGRALYAIPDDALFLLVFGGSLGARHLNNAVVALKDDLLALPNLYVVQSTGDKNYDDVMAALGEKNPRWKVLRYIDEMGDTLAGADMVISRAGSTSLAEIAVIGVPALLVPFPYATDDHQTKNARDWQDANACAMYPDADLDSPDFEAVLKELLENADKRKAFARNVAAFGKPDAAEKLAELVIKTASKSDS